MSRLTAVCALLLISACAPRGSIPASAAPEMRENMLHQGSPDGSGLTSTWVTTTHRPVISEDAIDVPSDKVFPRLLSQIYADLGLPVTAVISSQHLIGSDGQRLRRVGGKRIAKYIDCRGLYGNANEYDVYASVRTHLATGEGGGSVVRTQVRAYAMAPTGSNKLECATTGELEALIVRQVRERSATTQP